MNPGSRYVRLLDNTKGQRLNNGTVAGGLAHALTQGMRGYASRKADEEEQQKAQQREQAMADTLAAMNGPALTSEGPTQDAASRARFEAPGRIAQMLNDPQTRDFGMMVVNRGLAPAPERYEDVLDEQGRVIGQRSNTSGRMAPVPANPYAPKPPPAGWQRTESGGMVPIPGGPADPGYITSIRPEKEQKRYIPIPGVGVMDLTTNQLVTPGTTAPETGGGLNVPPVPRAGGGLPPAVAAKVTEKEAIDAYKQLGAMRENVDAMGKMAEMANRFDDLLLDQDTGGILRQSEWARNINGAFDSQIQEMNSISDKMTPLLRNGFPGAASDSDRRMFRGGAPGSEKSPEVNRNIIVGMQTAAQNAQDRLSFMEAYVGQNNTLRGANEQWQKYLNANPIFDPNGNPSAPSLNTGRQSWREFFTAGNQSNDAPLNDDERREIEQLRKELGQ